MTDQLITKGKGLLDEQLQAYGLGGLLGKGSNGSDSQTGSLSDGMNRYQLAVDGLSASLSVLSVTGYEHLSEPWQYVIQFTAQHGLTMEQVLSEKAIFSLAPGGVSALSGAAGQLSNQLMSAFNAFGGMFGDKVGSVMNAPVGGFSINSVSQLASRGINVAGQASSAVGKLGNMASSVGGIAGKASGLLGGVSSGMASLASLGGDGSESRILYGIVTAFSQLSNSNDEARYEVTLSPRLALLDNTQGCAIYQNQTVPQVVEAVLRKHEFTGVDFAFDLTDTYPSKEYITQWQESDLAFIRRLLADAGIWFRFETQVKHSCDVVLFGDTEQQYQNGPTANYHQPSGNNDGGIESVWDMAITRKTVPQSVLTQDYNYRNAQAGMKVEVNGAQKDKTTRGQQYLYGEHYRDKGEAISNGNAQDQMSGQFSNLLPGGLGDIPGVSDLSGAAGSVKGAVGGSAASGLGGLPSPTGIMGSNAGSSMGGVSGMAGSVGSAVSGAASSVGFAVSGAAQGVMGQAKGVSGSLGGLVDKGSDAGSDEPNSVGQGSWYGRLRHQRHLTEQVTIRGKTTLSHLVPGHILTVSGSPIGEAGQGMLIVSIESAGDRQNAYHIHFTAIPYDALRPYRPALLPWPTIGGTVPARVTSPDNDTYGYLDTQGRYRVKMDFDLNDKWRKGEESLWMRFAKPYSGETYGMHFPLIDGTEVAVAFSEGNPDRPYIAHGMHDSRHPDLVTAANHKRNVIRTPANNKLRMDDERGKEHIKVSTEYGKTQLNIGHLVDGERKQRGEGFELRTDEWGAIRAAKGVLLSSYSRDKAQGNQLDIDETIAHLENALGLARSFARQLETAGIQPMDVDAQERFLTQSIKELKQPAVIATSPAGISLSSSENIQHSTNADYVVAAQKNMTFSVLNNFIAAAKKSITLFASGLGIKLVSAKGNVSIEAHQDAIDVIANKNVNITSIGEEIIISSNKKITLNCNGSYITLDGSKIEIGTLGDVIIKSASFSIEGPQDSKVAITGFEQCAQLATKSAADGNGLVPLG
ncbi:type VI secretion system tip protein VgrG [Budvicia diplopodorum]|uniref:type VI secretion system tip protein VgrG n=1 Tax=Budvicia diplopodorum TaxID=1119056 RepID=UPI00135C1D95|nr:type VI secretion system tip protein VgrG [Budvicia diplopodorum]